MRLCLLIVLFFTALPFSANAERRVALLIGNEAYENSDFVLKNPGNDVRAVGESLERLNFDVRAEVDLSREAMLESLSWFRSAAEGADIAMVFFAGHAIQVGSENFLIGVGLSDLSPVGLVDESVTLSEVFAALEGVDVGLGMIVLDACRDNPFGQADFGQAGLSPSSGGVGTLVAYSTDPGNVAADGFGDNSTFTEALLEHIETPGLDVRILFGRVRQQVVAKTVGLQVPWVEEAVLGEFYLAAPPEPLDPTDELRVWQEAVRAGTTDGFDVYLEKFPEGIYTIVAQLRIGAIKGDLPEATNLDDADVPAAEAALELIGYIVPGSYASAPGTVRQAFARWQSAQPAGEQGFAALMGEGARTAAFLGTYTAGILKNDLRRFASADEQLRTGRENLRVAEAEFGDDPNAQQALQTMRKQVDEITKIQQSVAGDLDASRTYYSDLVDLTDRYLADWMAEDLQPRFASSRGITRLSERALTDAQTFFAHVRLARDAPDGSYTWLASMMKEL